eukprot:9323983-Pyramimonas_sp.AAC.1
MDHPHASATPRIALRDPVRNSSEEPSWTALMRTAFRGPIRGLHRRPQWHRCAPPPLRPGQRFVAP